MEQLKQFFMGAFFTGVILTPLVWTITNTPPYPLAAFTVLSGFAIMIIQYLEK